MRARVLVVCTANVCRSPVIASLLAARLGPTIEIVSRGTRAATSSGTCEVSATWAMTHGIGLPGHVSMPLELADVRASTIILTATRRHRRSVVELRPSMQVRTFTLTQAARVATWLVDRGERPESDDPSERLLWLTRELDAARGIAPIPEDETVDDLPDPHFGADHAEVFERIVTAVDAFCAPILADGKPDQD